MGECENEDRDRRRDKKAILRRRHARLNDLVSLDSSSKKYVRRRGAAGEREEEQQEERQLVGMTARYFNSLFLSSDLTDFRLEAACSEGRKGREGGTQDAMLCWQTSRTAVAATAALPKDGVHPPARRSRRTLRSRSWAQAGTPPARSPSPARARPRIRLPTSFTSCLLAHLAHSRCIHPSPLSSSFPFPTHAIAEGRCQQSNTRKLMSMGQPKILISSQSESNARQNAFTPSE